MDKEGYKLGNKIINDAKKRKTLKEKNVMKGGQFEVVRRYHSRGVSMV